MPEGPDIDVFVRQVIAEAGEQTAQTMLTLRSRAYAKGCVRIANAQGVEVPVPGGADGRDAVAQIARVSGERRLSGRDLNQEVFGALGLIVTARDLGQMSETARRLTGQLTATLQINPDDETAAVGFVRTLELKAGRILSNGCPTGVEVSAAMMHSGPYPASTNFGTTSVGTLSICRFLRAVCYQLVPPNLLLVDPAKSHSLAWT